MTLTFSFVMGIGEGVASDAEGVLPCDAVEVVGSVGDIRRFGTAVTRGPGPRGGTAA